MPKRFLSALSRTSGLREINVGFKSVPKLLGTGSLVPGTKASPEVAIELRKSK